jgi:spore coat protein CotF
VTVLNPVVESLLGIKAFNDQFIAEDLLQDNRHRMKLLMHCLDTAADPNFVNDLLMQLTGSIRLEQRLLELCLAKDWLNQDASEQFARDMKWAYKARLMIRE